MLAHMQEASLTHDQSITPVYWFDNFKSLVASIIKFVTRFYIILSSHKEQQQDFRAGNSVVLFLLYKSRHICFADPFLLKVKRAA